MDERLRQKFLTLIDGDSRLFYHANHLFNLVHRERIVDWLLEKGLKGKLLYEWVEDKHGGLVFSAIEYVVADINRAPKRPLRLGIDYSKK